MGSRDNGAGLAACFAAFTMALPTSAYSADTATSVAASGLEEVMVTARRREENAQSVPMAITAFSPATLQQQDMRTVTDLERSIPGLNLCCGRGRVDFAWLRGIPGVVGYFSEAPVNLSGSALLFDLNGVSALKGPQGTLFGLSTNGGALLYAPAPPTEVLEGYAQSILGNYDRQTTEGVLNAPLLDGKLLLRAGAQVSHTDGYIRDLTQNKFLNDENYWVARISMTARPSEGFENTSLLNYYEYHDNGTSSVITDLNPNGFASLVYGADTIRALYERQRELGVYSVTGSGMPGGTSSEGKQLNFINTTSWNIADDLTLKNIYAYQRVHTFSQIDLDTTPLPIIDYGSARNRPGEPTTQHTEELQLQGKALAQKLTYTVGTFHSWIEQNPTDFYMEIFSAVSGSRSGSTARTRAVFAQGTYDLSGLLDGLSVTAGYRYSWDKRTLETASLNAAGEVLTRFADSGEWSAPSYTLSLQYEVAPQTMLFVTNSKGYSSGGFNQGNFIPSQFATFEPESLNNIEAGVKTDWAIGDVQGRLNLTAFYGIYDDIQTYLVVPGTPDAPPPGTVVVRLNAAKGHIEGVDAELTVLLFDSLELSGNATIINASYDEYIVNGEDASGRDFVFVPELKYGLRASYRLPVNPSYGDVSVSADYSRQTKVNGNANKNVPIRQDYRPAFDNLNLSLNWDGIAGRSALSGTLFVTNATENHFGAGGTGGGYEGIGFMDLQVVAPRMWGVRLRYGF